MVIFNGKLGYLVGFELVRVSNHARMWDEIQAVTLWAKDHSEVSRVTVRSGRMGTLNRTMDRIKAVKANPALNMTEEQRLQGVYRALNAGGRHVQ